MKMNRIYIILTDFGLFMYQRILYHHHLYVDNVNFLQSSAVHPKGDTLQQILDEYISLGVPGATMLLADQNGVWIGSAGFADIKRGLPYNHVIFLNLVVLPK